MMQPRSGGGYRKWALSQLTRCQLHTSACLSTAATGQEHLPATGPQHEGLPGGSDGKQSACSTGDPGSIPGSGRSPGEGHGNPLQYSCLEHSMHEESWRATVRGGAQSRIRLSDFTFMHWRRQWQPTPVSLPGESQGRGSLVGCRLWGRTE